VTEYDHNNEISIEFVILQHLVQIGNLSTHLYTSTRAEWQTNALNYVTAVENLEALAQPYLSIRYLKRVSLLDITYKKKIDSYNADKAQLNEAYLRKGQNYEMGLTIAYALTKLKYIQLELNGQGILRKRTASATDDGQGADIPGEPSDAGSTDSAESPTT